MSEPNILYKLLSLELLKTATFSLSNAQIAEFFVKNGYSNYFTQQRILHELLEAELVTSKETHNLTLYDITEKGLETLSLMNERITPAMKEDIRLFFGESGIEMEEQNSVTSDYFKSSGGGYLVTCRVFRDNQTIIDLSLHAASEDMARTISTNWKRDYESVYASLMDILLT